VCAACLLPFMHFQLLSKSLFCLHLPAYQVRHKHDGDSSTTSLSLTSSSET